MKIKSAYVYTARRASRSALDLAKSMRVKRIRTNNSHFKPDKHKAIINWGVTRFEFDEKTFRRVVNLPSLVGVSSNKLTFFQYIQALPENIRPCVPPWTTDIEEAKRWQAKGHDVVARRTLTGHSGNGIVICGKGDTIPQAPLYTQYVKKEEEYRVHFVKDASDPYVQRKVRVLEVQNPDWKVRNLRGGFRYANAPENVGQVPALVLSEAKKAFEGTGLDFCCVDVIYNRHSDKAYVLEVNTAPGLMGKTLEFYSKNLTKLIESTL